MQFHPDGKGKIHHSAMPLVLLINGSREAVQGRLLRPASWPARRPHSRSQLLTLCWELTCLLPGHSLVGDESASSASPCKATASLACFTGPRFQALELKTQPSPWTPAVAGGSHAPVILRIYWHFHQILLKLEECVID